MSIERLSREESGRVPARVIRLVGEADLAEEAVQVTLVLARAGGAAGR